MDVGRELQERVAGWDALSRWERSALGRDLRRRGLSYGEIMDLIPVKKSTLATWCRDIDLTKEQALAIRNRTGSWKGVPRDTNRKRRAQIADIESLAWERAHVLRNDPYWVAGVVLYWAEGSKTSRRVEMAHSEPEALRLFMDWVRTYHRRDAAFSASLNLHFDNDEAAAKRFWSTELAIDPDSFTKTFVKPEGTGHRKNQLSRGVCRLTMRKSTDAFLVTAVWIEFVKTTYAPNIGYGPLAQLAAAGAS